MNIFSSTLRHDEGMMKCYGVAERFLKITALKRFISGIGISFAVGKPSENIGICRIPIQFRFNSDFNGDIYVFFFTRIK